MSGTPFLEGDRVALHPVDPDDLAFVRSTINDPSVRRYLDRAAPMNETAASQWSENRTANDDVLDLVITAESEPVGLVSVRVLNRVWRNASLTYWVAPAHQEQGYAGDAVDTIVRYAFDDRGLHKLLAHVVAGNDPSIRLLEAVGFEREGTHRDEAFVDGQFRDLYAYGLVASAWADAPG